MNGVSVGWIVNVIIFAVLLVITVLSFVGGVASLIHAVVTRPDAFPAVDTKSKGFWIGVLAASTLATGLFGVFRLLALPIVASSLVLTSFSGLIFLAGVVGISVYLAGVRPRIDEIQGRSWFRKAA